MKTDQLSQELIDARSRLTVDWRTVTFDVRSRISALIKLMQRIADDHDEILRHVPVSAVAALQTMCKGLVIDLVGMGEPYRTRASELIKDRVAVKDVLEWFYGESFTFGEVVAHALKFNSIGDVHSIIEKLLGLDLKAQLISAVDPYALRNGKSSPPLIADVGAVYREIELAFKIRHILAHEAASGLELDQASVQRMLDAVKALIEGIDAVLWATAYAHLPLTQYEMNVKAGVELREATSEMEAALKRTIVLAERDGDAQWIRDSQFKWQEFMQHWADSSYGKLQGAMWPSVEAVEKLRMIKARTEQLRQWNGLQIGDQSDHPDHPKNREPRTALAVS